MRFYSQQGEDLFIYLHYINQHRDDGIFLELGACDGVRYSNTLFFQECLGFSGILIEPVKEMYDMLIKNRQHCKCFNNAISRQEEPCKLLISRNGPVSGIKANMTSKFIEQWHKNSIERNIETRKLSDILESTNTNYIDFLSLDVEGGELDVLNTINWNKVSIYIICIELDGHNKEKNEKCRELLRNNGFNLKMKLCINEFWINQTYFRKELLFDESKCSKPFSGDINDYGEHVFSEKHCKPIIEKEIINYVHK